MITELNVFSPGSYVSAEEWNGNFNVINKVNSSHAEAIDDAYNELAFPDSNLSNVFARVKITPNSHYIDDYYVDIAPEQEYYKVLSNGQNLVINIPPTGLNAESRILIQTQNDRSLLPFSVNYSGTLIVNHYNNNVFRAGYYYIMIYETNSVAQVKLIWAGV